MRVKICLKAVTEKAQEEKKLQKIGLILKLYMRVSEEEQLLIKEKANQNNISVAEYIRQAVLDKMNK
ncbi:DUF6290 family protein [Brachyspira hyodysenteriae]|nr:DUF6290 family protein [Brachyspira hyodysenteriae]MDA0041901.1 DUF6290 family protein [Brachyspira hyodysenteriae]